MAFNFTSKCSIASLIIVTLFVMINSTLGVRQLSQSTQPMSFTYHKGPLLSGHVSINLIWYGNFKPTQKAIVSDFINSLSSTHSEPNPSVAKWWTSIGRYYRLSNPKTTTTNSILSITKQVLDETYSLGKTLTTKQIEFLALKDTRQLPNTINIILTSADVSVEGFCMSRCGTHGSTPANKPSTRKHKTTYIWVGNSETQCPGQCAWPFHQPIYGPQGAPLVAPNNDVGVDGMVINLASLLAGTVTNPYGNGYFQGPKDAPLEAASACTGVYGKGAYPGYAGELLVEGSSGASYNANGVNGRKYLLPALYDPTTSSCSILA